LITHGINVAALPPSLDVVVPTYRVDIGLLRGICGNTTPANQGTVTHVVVDNPCKVRRRVAAMQKQLSIPINPVVIHVNSSNRGVTSSRNRGIQASGADWIVLQDDDVVPDPGLLQAYSTAIQHHTCDGHEQLPLGFCGMIHFPQPYNGFTAAMRMSGVPNAFEIAELTRTPVWECTANVCMRNGPWLRYVEDWEKTGGGEDMDLFLRLHREVGGVIASVP
jgi:glycosyltransferase involved in cell wall biosynthesis